MSTEQSSSNPVGRGAQAIIADGNWLPIEIARRSPPPDLAYWIDYLWVVRWQTAKPHVQRVIPHPVVHLAAEDGRLLVHGVGETHFSRTLLGEGRVVGVALRPGGLRGFTSTPMSSLARSVCPAAEVIGVDDRPLARELLSGDRSDDELAASCWAWLRSGEPTADPMIEVIAGLVRRAEGDVEITRAEQLADVAGVSLRSLQRQFAGYVGIGPKWVIQRFRLLDVAAVANAGGVIDWASTAQRLGFTDQPHLIRAFRAIVGSPPKSYVRNQVS